MEEEFWTFNSIHPCLKDIKNFKLDFFSKLSGRRPLLHSAEISELLGKLLPILNYSDILSCRRLSRLIIFFKWHWESQFRVDSKIKKHERSTGVLKIIPPGCRVTSPKKIQIWITKINVKFNFIVTDFIQSKSNFIGNLGT